ncbi:MAG TPA: type IV pili twitching motility protein PilT, partial [Clostridiales bacterium]|nr:type IV pili twitching motility protein PilT [Clostridiales bacterium]
SNLIRESKVHQLNSVIYSSENEGMISMDTSILELYRKGIITKENAIMHAMEPEAMLKKLK